MEGDFFAAHKEAVHRSFALSFGVHTANSASTADDHSVIPFILCPQGNLRQETLLRYIFRVALVLWDSGAL